MTFAGVDGIDGGRGAAGHPAPGPAARRPRRPVGPRPDRFRWSRTTGTELGTVTGVEANPASDLLVLDGGGLIPLRFVTGSEPGVRVTVDIPDGLLDLT